MTVAKIPKACNETMDYLISNIVCKHGGSGGRYMKSLYNIVSL